MERPTSDIRACKASHGALVEAVAALADDVIAGPSRLAGWTVGHVLTHLARNADGFVGHLEGARRGEVVDQYAGGREGRDDDIEAGAARSPATIVADVAATAVALDAALETLPGDCWARHARMITGVEVPVALVPFLRWREVEIHLVDLGIGYGPEDWPGALVERLVPEVVAGLSSRTDQRALLAWGLGRGPAPDLRPWP